ncbi:MAG: hypothetical protein AAFY56_21805 [Pseudomonadota bacterium]
MRQDYSGEGDDSYLASVSDLVIGLLFIFIIILMAFGLNFRQAENVQLRAVDELVEERDAMSVERDRLREETRELADERQQMVRLTQDLEAFTAALEARDDSRRKLLEEIRAYLALRNVDVLIEPENGILRLPEELLFDTAEAQLRPEGEQAVFLLADVMGQILPCYSRADPSQPGDCVDDVAPILEAVLVEGHTDHRPINTPEFQDNWELGAIRGINTFRALTNAQPDLELLRNPSDQPLLGVSSYEARRPVGDPASEAGRARNRRIDLRFIVAAPTPEELAEFRANMLETEGQEYEPDSTAE